MLKSNSTILPTLAYVHEVPDRVVPVGQAEVHQPSNNNSWLPASSVAQVMQSISLGPEQVAHFAWQGKHTGDKVVRKG